MNENHQQFLQSLSDEIERFTEEHLPDGLSPENIQVNVKILSGKGTFSETVRLIGNTLFIRLDIIKFDTPPSNPAQRMLHRGDKFLGLDTIWVNPEHLSSVAPGKDMEIDGVVTKTCYIVSSMEDSLYRLMGTCEDFFDSMQDLSIEYAAQSEMVPMNSEQEALQVEDQKEKE